MFWADELAAGLSGPQVVNDSKTPSGTVHVGSLRGVVLHDAITRALRDHGLPTVFRYGVDDLDPMDAQALLTPDAVDRYMGVPLAHVPARMAAEKGAPLDARELAILEERVRVARAWLDELAPDRYKVEVQAALPESVSGLTEAQRIVLATLAGEAEATRPGSGAAWQDLIFGTSQTYGVSSGDAFAAIYLAFLDRTNGPRAGWLLASLDAGFVVQRLRDAAGQVPTRTPAELAAESALQEDG